MEVEAQKILWPDSEVVYVITTQIPLDESQL